MKISELKSQLRFHKDLSSALTGAVEEEKTKSKEKAKAAFDRGIKVGLTTVAVTAALIGLNSFVLDRLDKWAKSEEKAAVDDEINDDNNGAIPYIRHH